MTYQNILDRLNHSISVRYPKPYGFARRLAPLLNVSQDTVYNKLSGRTRFSIEELIILINELRIPLSEIMEENPVVEMHPMELRVFDHNHPDGSSGMSEWYSKTFATASASTNSRLMRLCNNIPEFSFADLKYLSAFSEQKWFFYNKGLETVPPLAQILKENTHRERDLSFSDSIRNIEAAEYILGIDITRNYVLDLIMFYEYNLISKDEGYSILQDLYDLLQTFERICLEGIDPGSGKVIDIYYHSTQIYGNNIEIIKSDNINMGIIYAHFYNPIIAHHSHTFDLLKSWYTTWKRSSIPITQAGIKNRIYFINEQKKALDYAQDVFGI